jgi:hypothetical protein
MVTDEAPADLPSPQPLVVSNDAVGSLFQRRWQQECETSLLFAAENRELHARNADLRAELDKLKGRVDELVAMAEMKENT